MTSTVAALFAAAGLEPEGVVSWGERMAEQRSGVYVVALTRDCHSLESTLPAAPMSRAAIEELLAVRPELTLDGRRPTAAELAARIAAFWLPDEVVVYIGLATSLRSRVAGYYKTPLGARRPHSGGWFLKTLDGLDRLHVHFAHVSHFDAAEEAMLEAFIAGVSEAARALLPDPAHPFPFANIELRRGARKLRKAHGIKGTRGDIGGSSMSGLSPSRSG